MPILHNCIYSNSYYIHMSCTTKIRTFLSIFKNPSVLLIRINEEFICLMSWSNLNQNYQTIPKVLNVSTQMYTDNNSCLIDNFKNANQEHNLMLSIIRRMCWYSDHIGNVFWQLQINFNVISIRYDILFSLRKQ